MNMLRNITPLQWIGVIILFNTTLIGGSSQLSDLYLTPGVVKAILAVATLGNGFLGGLVTMFGGQAAMLQSVQQTPGGQAAMVQSVSNLPGVERVVVNARANTSLAQQAVSNDPVNQKIEPTVAAAPFVEKVAKGSAVPLMILMLLLIPYGAHAQQLPRLKPLTGDVAKDFNLKPTTSPTGGASTSLPSQGMIDLGKKFQEIAKDLLDKAISDLGAASADAQVHNDQISQPCWDAQAAFFKSLPAEQASPPTMIGPALAIQISRDLHNTIAGNDKTSLKVACAALLGDQLNILNQILGAVGVTALTGLPAGL